MKFEQFTEDDYWLEEIPKTQTQTDLSSCLRQVLKCYFAKEKWFVTGNLAIFPPDKTYPFLYLAPDVTLFKGMVLSPEERAKLHSWRMADSNRPAPSMAFQLCSKGEWTDDLDPKPQHYGLLGVKEYFAYDTAGVWQNAKIQLRGWRYKNGIAEEMELDERGWLWSEELESWLVPDGRYLRLLDRELNLRLTGEAAALEREYSALRLAAEAEQLVEAERAAKEAALLQAELERQQAEAERKAMQILLEKLRQRNIDPDLL